MQLQAATPVDRRPDGGGDGPQRPEEKCDDDYDYCGVDVAGGKKPRKRRNRRNRQRQLPAGAERDEEDPTTVDGDEDCPAVRSPADTK